MARKVDYVCNHCGYDYMSIDKIFWIDEFLSLHVEPLLKSTSSESSDAPVKGYFTNYYCYNCQKFIDKFIIFKKSSEINDEKVIRIIEHYGLSSKIIQFDDVFQKCLKCGGELVSRADYSFVLDGNDQFHIGETVYDFSNSESYKFAGEYHGYFCSHCKKQINKFVITENNVNYTDEEIIKVLEEHTNDLTIFIRRDFEVCPDCGEEIYYLHDGSICPRCMEGRFIIEDESMID